MLTIRHMHADGTTARLDPTGFHADDLPPDGWFWVDLSTPTPDEAAILETLGLHPLIIEDMRDDRHLPKVEVIEDQLNLTVHGLRLGTSHDDGADPDVPAAGRPPEPAERAETEVRTAELDIALLGRVLVTWHRRQMRAIEAVGHHVDRARTPELGRPIQLLHRILDTLNDVMVPFIDHFEQRLDVVEDDLLSEPTHRTRDDLYRLQRDIIQLRRVVVPQAEVLRRLERDAATLMSEWLDPDDLALFSDVYDHLYRIAGLSESYQQLIDSAMSSYRAAQDDELNDMLRVLTLVSVLLLPITVIASIYGTNFTQLPGSTEPWGFAVMLGASLLVVVAMLAWFRLRGWIGGDAERAADRRRDRMRATLDVSVLGTALKVPVSGARAVTRSTRRLGRRFTSGGR